MAAGDRADLHRPPDPHHLPPGLQTGLGCAAARHQAHLHRRQRRRRPGRARRAGRAVGAAVRAIVRLWENAWEQFIPFLDYDTEIRQVLCSTNAIESLNARYRRAVKARGHFPTEQAALKCLYLVTRSLDTTGRGKARWTMRWKPALNAFAITFGDRFPAAETY